MGLGGFKRALKIEAGKVVEQLPPSDARASGPEWVTVDIPNDLPAHLNYLIALGILSWDGSSLSWPSDAKDQRGAQEARDRKRELEFHAVQAESQAKQARTMGFRDLETELNKRKDRKLAEAAKIP